MPRTRGRHRVRGISRTPPIHALDRVTPLGDDAARPPRSRAERERSSRLAEPAMGVLANAVLAVAVERRVTRARVSNACCEGCEEVVEVLVIGFDPERAG